VKVNSRDRSHVLCSREPLCFEHSRIEENRTRGCNGPADMNSANCNRLWSDRACSTRVPTWVGAPCTTANGSFGARPVPRIPAARSWECIGHLLLLERVSRSIWGNTVWRSGIMLLASVVKSTIEQPQLDAAVPTVDNRYLRPGKRAG
jgi:hypothetical protein